MGLFGLIPFVFPTAHAQTGAPSGIMVEAGTVRVTQPRHDAVLSAALSVTARKATARTALSGSALLVQSSDSMAAARGTIGAEVALPRLESLRLETSANITAFGALSEQHGNSSSGYVRPHIVRKQWGAFGTLGAGTIRRDTLNYYARMWDAGSWIRRGPLSGVLIIRQSFTTDSALVDASGFRLLRDARHHALQDVQAIVSAQFNRVELQAAGTWRSGRGATFGQSRAFFMSAQYNVNSRVALVASGGKQLAEPLSGTPSARLLGASLRVNLGRKARPIASPRSSDELSSFATHINRHASGGASVTVRVDAPANARVELSGSFNDWKVIAISRVGELFETTFELPSGTHRVAVRVNGGQWKSPVGLVAVKDDLGGEAGLVVVP